MEGTAWWPPEQGRSALLCFDLSPAGSCGASRGRTRAPRDLTLTRDGDVLVSMAHTAGYTD
jgi:hypothetical protein